MFDYVIVGGGSAGCVLAARLSEDPSVTVCLLESGPADTSPLIHTPVGALALVPRKHLNWAYETVPQPALNGRRGYQPRGKVLGGSSSINAMIYLRGHRWDYDHWAALGNSGWSYDEVLPYFRRAENNERGADLYHGSGGPLNVADLRSPSPVGEMFIDAARECGIPYNPDFNGAEQEGAGPYQVTQKNGERCSAARAFLKPALARPNLRVLTEAHTIRVVFDGVCACGVEYLHAGRRQTVHARREVILSAGAFGSPQLLMLSGIGPAEHLRELGIPVLHHLPGVGRNLQDHPDFIFINRSSSLDTFGISPRFTARLWREWRKYQTQRRGMLTSNFAEAGAFIKSGPHQPIPDLQIHFVVGMVEDHARKLLLGHGYSGHVCLLRPKSRGQVRLVSTNSLDAPLIDLNLLGDNDDLQAMLRAFRITREIMRAPALAAVRGKELHSAGVESDDEIRALLRQRVDCIYHPVGTCRMGSDADAVVDDQLRVHGVSGLRVVDASIMPTLIGGNTNAPTIMIGEKAADMIRAACNLPHTQDFADAAIREPYAARPSPVAAAG
ncbi:MAG: choline dehydrogenase [Chitinivorax sp.]